MRYQVFIRVQKPGVSMYLMSSNEELRMLGEWQPDDIPSPRAKDANNQFRNHSHWSG